MNFRSIFFSIILLINSGLSLSHAEAINPITKTALIHLKESIKTWAPMNAPTNSMAQNLLGEQGDILQRAGLLCLYGNLERCADVKNSQDEEGQFWRGPGEIKVSSEDSFSRDHFNGVMAYYVATKLYSELETDVKGIERYTHYIENTKRLCTDATDNRCHLMVGGWSLLGRVQNFLGLPISTHMKWTKVFTIPSLFFAAYTTPRNYQMSLPAYEMLIYQKMGFWNNSLEGIARHLSKRAKFNPMLRYPAEGPTEELAQLTLKACPAKKVVPDFIGRLKRPKASLYDFIWNGDIFVDPVTKKMTIAKRFEEISEVSQMPTEMLADGWDCLLMIQILLDQHPFREADQDQTLVRK